MDDSNTAGDSQDEAPSEPSKRVYSVCMTEHNFDLSSLALVVKKVAPLIASKKTANNINKWNQVQEELAHDIPSPAQVTLKSSTTFKSIGV